ncbi:uncharacterized protein LOC100877857 [Megachile rotundata]|uniref:uncharacterized protein LOC100877857 n=1 Tax=Megachile rotundata TaxID=143995 RepID=UPI003FD3BB48
MYITTNNDFVATDFRIYTFYNERTCFCWNKNKFVIFPYKNDSRASVKVLTAPSPIKTLQCFNGRIFVICIPQGVYKLSRDLEFCLLSTSAIEMGTMFYEVLVPRDKYLYLDNKQKMESKRLFQLSCEKIDSNKLCVYILNTKNTAENFMKALISDDLNVESLCIIGEEKKLFILKNETAQIIYNSVYVIRDIISMQKDSGIAGLFLLTNTDIIIIMYSKNNTLVFENICLRTKIQTICIGFSQSFENTLWIVYADECKVYYAQKELSSDNVKCMKVQDNNINCLQCYDSKIILGLTENNQLIEFPVDSVERTLSLDNNMFNDLHPDMLKGTKLIMDKIYKGTQELNALNEILTREKDKLKVINLYALEQKIRRYPKIVTVKVANQFFLSTNFQDSLPKGSWVVFNVNLDCQNLFCMKAVTDQETTIDVQVPEDKTLSFSQVTVDLIALKEKGYPWCLIRNYIINSDCEKNKKRRTRSDKTEFINSRIAMLQNYIQERNVDIKQLSEIKKRLRKELNGI